MQLSATHRRGVLNPRAGERHFRFERLAPPADLTELVERHWIVEWDLRGREPYRQGVLSHPSVNLAFEDGGGFLYGPGTGQAVRELRGTGKAVATKFRPGAFHAVLALPAWTLTDRRLPVAEAFGADGTALEHAVRAAALDEAAQLEAIEDFLRAREPVLDEGSTLVARAMGLALELPAITRVDELAARLCVSERTLQRTFRRYVGVTPKWVLQRTRLHEAAERIADGRAGDWVDLALELGWFDQAHFVNDFTALVGCSPTAYAAACAAAEDR